MAFDLASAASQPFIEIAVKESAFKIVGGWWGRQPRQSALAGVSTDHFAEYEGDNFKYKR